MPKELGFGTNVLGLLVTTFAGNVAGLTIHVCVYMFVSVCVLLPCFWLFYFTIDPNCARATIKTATTIATTTHSEMFL